MIFSARALHSSTSLRKNAFTSESFRFDKFKRKHGIKQVSNSIGFSEKEQKWYYTNVYKSLIYNEEKWLVESSQRIELKLEGQ